MARYFDSFNRTNGAAGTSDSGDVYSTMPGHVLPVILSNTLANTDAINPAAAMFDLGLQEFDTTILLGTIVGKTLTYAIRMGAPTDGIIVSINGSSDGVLVNGTIGIVKYVGSDILFNSANTLIVNAGVVRIVNTKRNIKVYYDTVLLINFNISLYSENSGAGLIFPPSAYAGSFDNITTKILGGALVSDISDRVKRKRSMPTTNTTQFSDAWFMETLGDVTRMILKEVPLDFMRNSVSVTAASAGRVILAQSVQDVTAVWITGYRPMTPMSRDEYFDLISRGITRQPFRYCIMHGGTDVYGPQMLTEPPDATYIVNYTYRPGFDSAYYAITDDVLFPADWIDAIVDFMTGHTYEKDEDPGNADRWFAKGVEKLTQIKSVEEDRYNRSIQKRQAVGRVVYVGAVEHIYQ